MRIQALIACLVGVVLLTVGLAAAEEIVPEIIQFDGAVNGGATDDVHPTIYSGPITFPHKKHFNEYGVKCGDCHHDEDTEQIVGYSPDKSFHCIDCHDEEGLIRGPIAENAATYDDLIARRANVLHIKCIGCHKEHNAKEHAVRAPESCRICHTKRAQDWTIETVVK